MALVGGHADTNSVRAHTWLILKMVGGLDRMVQRRLVLPREDLFDGMTRYRAEVSMMLTAVDGS